MPESAVGQVVERLNFMQVGAAQSHGSSRRASAKCGDPNTRRFILPAVNKAQAIGRDKPILGLCLAS